MKCSGIFRNRRRTWIIDQAKGKQEEKGKTQDDFHSENRVFWPPWLWEQRFLERVQPVKWLPEPICRR